MTFSQRLTNFPNLREKYLNIHDFFSSQRSPFHSLHITPHQFAWKRTKVETCPFFILLSRPWKKKKEKYLYDNNSNCQKIFSFRIEQIFQRIFVGTHIYIFDEPFPVNISGNIHRSRNESIRVATESSHGWCESTIATISKRAHGLYSWPSWEALPAERGTRWLCHCQKVILRARPEDKSFGGR